MKSLLQELKESNSRPMHSDSMWRDEIAKLSHDLAVDGHIPKALKPSEITDKQVRAYEKLANKLPDSGPQEVYDDGIYDAAKKALTESIEGSQINEEFSQKDWDDHIKHVADIILDMARSDAEGDKKEFLDNVESYTDDAVHDIRATVKRNTTIKENVDEDDYDEAREEEFMVELRKLGEQFAALMKKYPEQSRNDAAQWLSEA